MKRVLTLTIIIFLVYSGILPLSVFSQDISVLMREGDALWVQRKEREKARASIDSYKKALQVDVKNYEAYWKIARAYFYLGDLLPETKEMRDQHREMGLEGMPYAKKAVELNPRGVEGHYYYTLTLGQYSIGISIIKALAKGLGPQYEEHIEKALEIDRNYDTAGPLRAIGRYWYQVPWPKRDLKKSIHYLKEGVASAPTSIRGHVYLGESYLKAGEKELAKRHLQKAVEIIPDLKQEVDAVRWKERAGELLKEKF
jgi:tetratricopeptide (TPR) repeat protein